MFLLMVEKDLPRCPVKLRFVHDACRLPHHAVLDLASCARPFIGEVLSGNERSKSWVVVELIHT